MLFRTNPALLRTALRGLALLALVAVPLSVTSTARAQEKVKKVPIQQTDAASGKEMYTSYCAACHGPTGKGNGPAAGEFKVAPADLSLLAKNNHGEFPSDHVWAILHFGTKSAAHGTSEMPVWGDLLHALEPNESVKSEQRIKNLVDYLRTLQAK